MPPHPPLPLLSAEAKKAFWDDGFVVVHNVIPQSVAVELRQRFEGLFRGDFESGVYPDEWHWREGISLPDAPREIVNGWKCDSLVSSVVRSPALGRLVADLMQWPAGTRLAQDDVLWKPPGAGGVGFHQDAAYISEQFRPEKGNCVTCWIALDDADDETGVVEYARGSHRWPQPGTVPAAAAATATLTSGAGSASTASVFHGQKDVHASVRQAAAARGITPDQLELITVPVPTGSCLLHHQDVWHGSRANVSSSRHRRALVAHLLR
jgi:phytanoyl-CoA hydroxylase